MINICITIGAGCVRRCGWVIWRLRFIACNQIIRTSLCEWFHVNDEIHWILFEAIQSDGIIICFPCISFPYIDHRCMLIYLLWYRQIYRIFCLFCIYSLCIWLLFFVIITCRKSEILVRGRSVDVSVPSDDDRRVWSEFEERNLKNDKAACSLRWYEMLSYWCMCWWLVPEMHNPATNIINMMSNRNG